jgi:peptidoglycan/xylan/chitin deacetylase (PgdA/CDA1 family)
VSEVLVLCYHGISSTWEASESVTPEVLERQLTYLSRRRWRSAKFRDAVMSPSTSRTLAITFDDAFASVKELAFPILSRLGLIATVFAPTSYVTAGERCMWSGLDRFAGTAHADELAPMTWNDLGELAQSGWEIGSHTSTHPHLTQLDDVTLVHELGEPREASLRMLGRAFDTIAYPYGDVDDRVADFTLRAGYKAGAALSGRLRDLGPHRYPRTGLYHRDVAWRFLLKTTPAVQRVRASRLWPAG